MMYYYYKRDEIFGIPLKKQHFEDREVYNYFLQNKIKIKKNNNKINISSLFLYKMAEN